MGKAVALIKEFWTILFRRRQIVMEIEPLESGAILPIEEIDDESETRVFLVSYFISCTLLGPEQQEYVNQIEVGVPVRSEDHNASYREIEDAGAQALPAFFRDLADAIEQDLARVDRKRAIRKAASPD